MTLEELGLEVHEMAVRKEPLPTATGRGAGYLVEPDAFLVPHFGERDGQLPRSHDVGKPLPAVTSHGAGHLVEPVLITTDQTGGNGLYARQLDSPLPTLLTKANQGLAEPCLLQVNHEGNDGRVRSAADPLFTTTTKRCVALAEPIIEEIRAGRIDKRRLVIIDDRLCMLDIRFRMLDNDELAAAMGFTSDERAYEFVGNKGEVTRQIGNAVPVRTATALVKAILS